MKKLGVKTSRYANTDLYTPDPIDEEGNGTIELSGLKYGFESGFQFYKLDVPKSWLCDHGLHEKYIALLCTNESRLTDWDEIEVYFYECVPDEDEDEEELEEKIIALY